MELVITDTLAKEIVRVSRSDPRLLRALADDWIARIAPEALFPYLLSDGIAVALLADRLKKNSERTLADLARLAGRGPMKRARAANKPQPAPPAASAPKPKPGSKKKKVRHRLNPAEIGDLKQAVVDFLATAGWASRGQIIAATGIPTPSLYNRVVVELRQSGYVVAKGEKASRLYALSRSRVKTKAATKAGTSKKAPPKKAPPKKAPPKKATKAKAKTKARGETGKNSARRGNKAAKAKKKSATNESVKAKAKSAKTPPKSAESSPAES